MQNSSGLHLPSLGQLLVGGFGLVFNLCAGGIMLLFGLLTLAQHEDGSPQSIAVYDQKEGTPRCEQTAATALLEKIAALDEKTVTADPLHCQKKVARIIVGKGGEYLLQIKDNQRALFKQAQALDALTGPLFSAKIAPATVGSKNAACAFSQ